MRARPGQLPLTAPTPAAGQRGSALVLATLVMVILTMLGIAYLTMADTENLIAINQTYQEQALHAAESATRVAVGWFNDPSAATGYLLPTTAQVNRTLRFIDHDNNPGTATITNGGDPVVEGNPAKPFYRDTINTLFDKPYRGSLALAFLGTEAGPDLVIDRAAGGNQLAFLTSLDTTLFGNYPSDIAITNPADAHLRARVIKIEMYQPPIVNQTGTWVRFGVATVKVTAGVFRNAHDTNAANDIEVARRVVKAVVNETPYPGPYGPLHSCTELEINGEFKAHWGAATSLADSELATNWDSKIPSTFPFATDSRTAHIYSDPLGAPGNSDLFDTWYANWQGAALEDPWFKYESGGPIDGQPAADIQPSDAILTTAPEDHSNVFHNLGVGAVRCPDFDYQTWKTIALSGGKDILYLAYDPGTQSYRLDGLGDPKSFRTWTEGEKGLFFFDTVNGQAPASDGSNLTPDISINGAAWNSKGFIYLNANDFVTSGAGTPPDAWIFPPGEPFVDVDTDGVLDVGEPHVNLLYPTVAGGAFEVDSGATQSVTADTDGDGTNETYTTTLAREILGPPFQAPVNMYGVFYTSGHFDAQGNFSYYGSAVAKRGIGPSAGTPDFWWDDRIAQGQWPPPGLALPRVVISRWEVEL